MIFTTKNLERLSENCEYNPEKIGIAILEAIGHNVYTYNFDDSIFVYSKDGSGKIIFSRVRH